MQAEAGPARATCIRDAGPQDAPAVRDLWNEAIAEGTTLHEREPVTDGRVRSLRPGERALRVEEGEGEVRGFYLLRENAPGRGSHVANAMYVVAGRWRGRGIGGQLARDSLEVAARLGFSAIQFNAVVSTNTASIALWRRLGFAEVGRVPRAFQLKGGEREGVVIFHRELSPAHRARVVEILVADSPASPAASLQAACAVPGRGIEGDRYFNGAGTFSPHPQKPDFEITLIQREHVEAFAAASGIAFVPRDARRNLVTVGVDLNALVGREFTVGEVRIRGIRLCEPCAYLAKQTSPEVLRGLVHKGGLRAQILSEGEIRVGDPVVEAPALPP